MRLWFALILGGAVANAWGCARPSNSGGSAEKRDTESEERHAECPPKQACDLLRGKRAEPGAVHCLSGALEKGLFLGLCPGLIEFDSLGYGPVHETLYRSAYPLVRAQMPDYELASVVAAYRLRVERGCVRVRKGTARRFGERAPVDVSFLQRGECDVVLDFDELLLSLRPKFGAPHDVRAAYLRGGAIHKGSRVPWTDDDVPFVVAVSVE